MKKYLVSLGAGHGGFDLGTIGPGGLAEKDVTLFIEKSISRRLAKTGAFEVFSVRPDDSYIGSIQRAGLVAGSCSRCHVELHIDLTQEAAKSAAVWYSADIPSDRAAAANLSHRLAVALGVPDCGARVRFDYCMLFKKLAGFEDYYSLIEALGAAKVGHVFYCECGFACAEVIRGGAGRLADSMAEAVARTICELFRVNAPVSLLPQKAPFSHAVVAVYPVYLKEGFFNLRSGPGAAHHVIRVIEGLIYSGFYARESGWLLLSGEGGEYLSEAAVDMYLNPQATGASPQPGGYEKETTGRDGFYFVLNQPRAGAEILGAVGTGVTFLTAYHRGYRLVNYCDRAGFIGPSAWR